MLSEEIDNLKSYNLFLNVFENGIKINDIVSQTKDNNVKPVFTYNHNPADGIYRGAIIGGDMFPSNSDFKDNIVFADHLSGELFLYNVNNGSVLISPFAFIKGGPSSIKIYDEIENTIILSTVSGEIHLINITK